MSNNKGNTAQRAGSRAGAAQSPQDSAGKVLKTGQGHVVAPGHSFQTKGGHLTEGSPVTLETFKTAKDETGKSEFNRQLEKGAIVAGKVRAVDAGSSQPAGDGGSTGAGPSGAQLNAAATGDDPDATKVADAALSGDADKLEAANSAGETTDKSGQSE